LIALLIASVFLFGGYSWFTLWCRKGLEQLSDTSNTGAGENFQVTVIVPFRNEAHVLADLIGDLKSQSYPHLEVILVDDHSSDDFGPLFKSLPEHFSLIQLQNQEGKKAAIAAAIAGAKGEIIFQTDADCYIPPEWIEKLLHQFDTNTSVVCGSVRMLPYPNFWSRFAALDFLSLQASGLGSIAQGKPFMASAASMAYRKSFYQQCERLNPQMASGDDVFLIQEAVKRGMKVKAIADPEATVRTYAPSGLTSFLQQRVRWGAKTPAYSSLFAKGIAALVLFLSVLIIVWLIYAFYDPWAWIILVIFYLAKIIADFQLLHQYSRLSGGTTLLSSFLPVSLLYPFYILTVSGLILLLPQNWKGRRIS